MIYYTGTNIIEKIYTFPNWQFENDKFSKLSQARYRYAFVIKVTVSNKSNKIIRHELIK